MRYLIYLRVSTKEQDEETQLDYCLNFIKQRDKTKFDFIVFRDKKTSKKPLFKREGGAAMLAALQKGDTIIAMRVDRISRRLHETTTLISLLESKGADVLLVEQPGITNKIMLGLYAGMAEEEVKLLGQRVSEKLETKKKKGERYSRFLPYGYAMHETKLVAIKRGDEVEYKRGVLVPVYEEQQALARMYEYSAQGKSDQEIAKALNNEGYKNRQGKPFQKMSIYRILSRKAHTMSGGQPLEEREAHLCCS